MATLICILKNDAVGGGGVRGKERESVALFPLMLG